MGGGGGSSGKVSYPAFMKEVHDKIIFALTDPTAGWNYTYGAVSPYAGRTAYDPQEMLGGMTESLTTFGTLIGSSGPKFSSWAPFGTDLPLATLASFTGAFDTSFASYVIAGLTESNMYLDADTYATLDTKGWTDVAAVDTWVPANEWEKTLSEWVPGTDYLSTVNIQGIYNTAYNAVMSRKGFTETAALKGKFRNSGGVSTSAFPIAVGQIEKMAVTEAMQVVLAFLKDRNMLSVENQKNLNAHTLEANRVLIAKRQVEHQVKDDQAKIGIQSVGENVKISTLRHAVKMDRSMGIAKASEVSLEASKLKVHVNEVGINAELEKAKHNTNIAIKGQEWKFAVLEAYNSYAVKTLQFWTQFQDTALRLTATIIAAKVDHLNQQIEFSEKDKLWHADKYDYMNRANASMSGGGSAAGTKGPSREKSALTGAMSGAAMGAPMAASTGGWSVVGGAVLGGMAGLMN